MSTIRFVVLVLVVILVLGVLNLGPVIAGLGLVLAAIAFAGRTSSATTCRGSSSCSRTTSTSATSSASARSAGRSRTSASRRTKLRDRSGTLHIVANGEIRIASNFTRGFGGVNLDMPIAYDADIDRAMAIIGDVGAALAADPEWADRIIEAPAAVRVETLGDIGMTIKVLGKVRAGEQWAVSGELRRRLLAAFAAAGSTCPAALARSWSTPWSGRAVSGDAVAVTSAQDELGEVRWDARRDELLRVDIPAGLVYRDRVADDGTAPRAGAAVRRSRVGGGDQSDRRRRRLAAGPRPRDRAPGAGRDGAADRRPRSSGREDERRGL